MVGALLSLFHPRRGRAAGRSVATPPQAANSPDSPARGPATALPLSRDEEAWLAGACDHAELERRLALLERRAGAAILPPP